MNQARPGHGRHLLVKPNKAEASLWRRFRFDDDLNCREAIFNRYRVMALKIARKQFRGRPAYGLERSDFEQFAYAGLLEAIDKYDPMRKVPFSAFARFRILGSISDGVTRSSEAAAGYSYERRVELDRLKSLDAGNASDDPLAQISNLAVGLALGFMLEDAGLLSTNDGEHARPNAYESLSWRELKLKLSEEVESLPSKERTVVKQHYSNGVTFVQIAQLLNLSKGRISQLHKAAIGRLRGAIGKFY